MEFLKRISVKKVNDSLEITDMPRNVEATNTLYREDGTPMFSIKLMAYNKKLVPYLTPYKFIGVEKGGYIVNKADTDISTSNLQEITKEFDTFYQENKSKYVQPSEDSREILTKENFDMLRKDFSEYMSDKLDSGKENNLNEDFYGNSLWAYYGNAINQDYSYNDIKEKANLYNLKIRENVNRNGRFQGRYIVIGKLEDISAFLDELDTGEYLLNEDNTANNELFKEWINKGILRKLN